MEERETINPNIINGIDLLLSFFTEILLDFKFLSLLIRFEKGLFTLKDKFSKSLIHCFK